MRNHYFSFGQGHLQKDGTPMKDYWVRVVADCPAKAREYFISVFSSVYMPAPDKWAFQYEENEFQKSYFPKGEYQVIFTGPTEENTGKALLNNVLNNLNQNI